MSTRINNISVTVFDRELTHIQLTTNTTGDVRSFTHKFTTNEAIDLYNALKLELKANSQ